MFHICDHVLNVTCFACFGEMMCCLLLIFLLAKSMCGICVVKKKNVQCTFQIHCEHIIYVLFIYKIFFKNAFSKIPVSAS